MAQLNKQQQLAIDADNNVVLVIAGAGSGKTTVLVEKIKDLITNYHLFASRILALTFTNNAAKQMKDRLLKQNVVDANRVNAFTFHGFCAYIMNRFSQYFDKLTSPISIIDTNGQKKIINDIIKDLNLDVYPGSMLNMINNAKTSSLTHDESINYIEEEYDQVYDIYQQYLINHNMVDFNDLLIYVYELLLNNQEARQQIQQLFDFILIDEYQDTSLIQDKIVELIKAPTTNLFVVGDVDQSIYRWRGALIENILTLEERYEDCQVIKLEQNYRSTKHILDAANQLIENNEFRYDKNLFTEFKGGKKIIYKDFSSPLLEANYIAKEIKFHQQLHPDKTIAVLYRKNTQSALIEEALVKNNITYQLLAGTKFFERQEVRDIASYLQLIFNHNDDISCERIINRPQRKIGEVTINKVKTYSKENNISLFAATAFVDETKAFHQLIIDLKQPLIDDFDQGFETLLTTINYQQFLDKISDNENQAADRLDNVYELKQTILYNLENDDISTCINNLLLYSNGDQITSNVILSTIHGVKGLEYDYVYIIGMNQGILPSKFNIDDQHGLEEERRLCYVAITRAKLELTLTSYEADKFGYYPPSQFLEELDLVDNDDFSI